jgi:hypothetical protein
LWTPYPLWTLLFVFVRAACYTFSYEWYLINEIIDADARSQRENTFI